MNRWQLKQAARALHGGGVIAYPTEAVYGLGCDPYNAEAVWRLLQLKQRPLHKGLILIASALWQLEDFIQPLDAAQRERIGTTWPGPATWIVPAHPATPAYLRGRHSGLAVRVTAHPLAAALCDTLGHALVSTSANRAGQRPARRALQVRVQFGDEIDYILGGPTGGLTRPTPIRDAQNGRWLRPG